jgi:hypothetical protein
MEGGVMTDITNIEDAMHFKRAGLPLTTPVERRVFAAESSKHYAILWGDLTKFCTKMLEYRKNSTSRNYSAWKRALTKMDRDARALSEYATALGDDEGNVLLVFLREKVAPFIEGWAQVFGALEDGEEITIQPFHKWDWNPLDAH